MKKLNLDELALKLPKIDEKNSKILLGGSYGNEDSAFNEDNTIKDSNSNSNDGQQTTNNIPDDYSDGQYDLDYSQDDQYQDADDYSYDQDGGSSNNGSSGTGSSLPAITESQILENFPESFSDGSDPQNYLFNLSDGNDNFTNQLMAILESNSIIKNQLAGFFNNQYVQMTFDVADIDSPAHFDEVSPESFHIVFDTDSIDADGFVGLGGVANVGYNHSGLTDAESLAIVIAHEMMHAKHQAVWNDAVESQGSLLGAVEWLADNGYSPDFALIFVNITINGAGNPVANYNTGEQISTNMHNYMQANNESVFEAVLEEFRDDVDAMQNHLDQLESEFSNKMNELLNFNVQEPDPTNPSDQGNVAEYYYLGQEVENLESEINYIQENYGWMLD